jgi:hypothetical protein
MDDFSVAKGGIFMIPVDQAENAKTNFRAFVVWKFVYVPRSQASDYDWEFPV